MQLGTGREFNCVFTEINFYYNAYWFILHTEKFMKMIIEYNNLKNKF